VRRRCPRRYLLQKFFSTFPEGWPGFGLLLLRLTVALGFIIPAIRSLTGFDGLTVTLLAESLFAVVVGVALLIGFLTPIAGTAAALRNLVVGVFQLAGSGTNTHDSTLTAINLAVMSIALVFLGPGAFSLDARLFGRRQIIVPERVRPHH
jgi:uncharacterized membrane protein YphA (DoxX/SURF4 family)